jgi:mRNA-degrading endonuclease RelE of RelBE toxin-antitoxin system
MKEAVEKDIQKLDKNLRDICESSLPLLRTLCDILPSKKALKAAGMSDNLLDGHESFSKLQVAMAEVNDKIAVSLNGEHESRH